MAATAFGFGSPTLYPLPGASWGQSPFGSPTPGGYPGVQPHSASQTVPFGTYGFGNAPTGGQSPFGTAAWGQSQSQPSPQVIAQWLQIVPQQLQQLQQLAGAEHQQLQQILQLLPLQIQQLQHLMQLMPHLVHEVQQLLVAQSPFGIGPMGLAGQYPNHPFQTPTSPQTFGYPGYVM
jgi:hypothetical protein